MFIKLFLDKSQKCSDIASLNVSPAHEIVFQLGSLITKLQEEGRKVCFVGDGINDSIALKKANVSISLRGASTVATDTAGIILMDGSLNKLINLLDIANELDANLTRSTVMAILPGVICVGGVFFLHFGLLSTIILYNIGLTTSVLNALSPLIRYQRKELKMFFTCVVIAGGTLIAGSKVYIQRKRKRKKHWTVAAERREKRQKKGQQRPSDTFVTALIKGKGQKIIPQGTLARRSLAITPLGNENRRQEQLLEIANSTEEIEISKEEQEINRYLALSGTSLALNVAGALFYPPLTFIGVPLISIVVFNLLKNRLTKKILKGKSVGVSVIEFIAPIAILGSGHYIVASFANSFLFFNEKLLRKTEDHSQKSLINVFGTTPRFVWIRKDDLSKQEFEIPFEQLSREHIVVVHAGHMIPVDGMITTGSALVDQSALTGESQPIQREFGDRVFASTVVLSGRIYIQVEKAGASTVAAQIGDILSSTTDFKSTIQSRGEQIIEQGAWPTLGLGLLALPLLGSTSAAAVLLSSFGYQMKFAAPLTVLNFLRIASENGVLIKDGRSLELLSTVDTFVFDKTGTLTEEVPTVGTIHTLNGYGENQLLTYAAAAEYKQTHPIARAIRQEAEQRELTLPPIADVDVEVGYGLKVKVENKLVRVGSERFMEIEGIAIPVSIKRIQESTHQEGFSLVYVAIDKQLGGAIELMPTIRPEALTIVNQLRERDISLVIISGDHEQPTRKLAQKLGIDNYEASVLPQDKASLIEELQEKGKSVCFVGDGINDSIALKKANVSISLSGASSIATDTASIILMDSTLKQLLLLVDLAREMDINLKTSTIMTVLPGVICVGGVFFFHIGVLSSILLSSGSLTLSVLNAFLPLLKYQKKEVPT
jgi:Cu2+-exporting ATPase